MSLKPFFEEEIEFFNHWFSNHPWELHTHDLAAEMREEDNHLVVEMHVPEDIDHEDISIELIGDNRLKVSGSCETMHEEYEDDEEDECATQKDCCKCTGDKCCKQDSCSKCAGASPSAGQETSARDDEDSDEYEDEDYEDEYECETFEQIVLLPADVDAQKATAELHNSKLTVRLPMIDKKKHEPKKINITVR